MPTLVNLTPHPITIITDQGERITLPPDGTVARVTTTEFFAGVHTFDRDELATVQIAKRSYGRVTGLPLDPHTACIVSSMVLAAVPGRPNTFAPDTGPSAERDADGNVTAVRRLIQA